MKIAPTRAAYVLALLATVSFAWALVENRRAAESELRLVSRQSTALVGEPYSTVRDCNLGVVYVSGHHVNVASNLISLLIISPKAHDVRLEANWIEKWANPPFQLSAPPGITVDFGSNKIKGGD